MHGNTTEQDFYLVTHRNFPGYPNYDKEIEYTFTKNKIGKKVYKELIGKERLVTKRKARKVGQVQQAKAKTRSTSKTKR